jgi:hypothetical protein
MAVGFSKSYGVGRVVSGQEDVIYRPRNGARGKRGVVLLHGHNQTVQHFLAPALAGQFKLAEAIAAAGLVCVALHTEGNGWGSDQVIADIESARTIWERWVALLTKSSWSGSVWVVVACSTMPEPIPTKVAALVGCIPACDFDDLRDNDRGAAGVRDAINTAFGLAAGSTSATVALPSRANPMSDANAALIAGSGAKIKLYYSTVDAVVIPATVTALATKLGVTPTVVDTTNGHSDNTLAAMPRNEVVQTLFAAA